MTKDIIKKGEQLKYPYLNNFDDLIGLIGILILISKLSILLFNRIPSINITFLSSSTFNIIAVLLLVLSLLGHETIGKTYKD